MYKNGSHLIDWLSITFPWDITPALVNPWDDFSVAGWAAPMCTDWDWSTVNLRGYKRTTRSGEGVMVAWSDRLEQGIHVQFGGQALNTLAVFGISDTDLLKWAVDRGAKITRIDIAVDGQTFMPFGLLESKVKRGEAKTRSRTTGFISSSTGTTVYVGHRSSEKFLRVYDKAGESRDLSGDDWTRAELVIKGDSAVPVVNAILAEGKRCIPSIIRAFCDFPDVPQWVEMMSSEFIPVDLKRPEKITDTDAWLIERISKTLARRSMETEGIVEAFLNAVGEERKRLEEIEERRQAAKSRMIDR